MSIISGLAVTGSGAAGGYEIERSLRLRSSASAFLSRTPGSASDRRTWTFSFWMKRGSLGVESEILNCYNASLNRTAYLRWNTDNTLTYFDYDAGGGTFINRITTTQVFRDPSAWYHIVLTYDTSNATSSERLRFYVNGQRVTSLSIASYPSLNYEGVINTTSAVVIGKYAPGSSGYFDGYITEVNFINAQALTPSDFGEYNATTGVWQPIEYAGTYGTNGFYLNFSDNASTTTLGDDLSGNGNDWTTNNISLTAGATYDSMIDTPTPYADGGNGRGNYCVLNSISQTSTTTTISGGNLNAVLPASLATGQGIGTIGVTSGKWYWETTYTASTGNFLYVGVGEPSSGAPRWLVRGADGELFGPTAPGSATAIRFASGDVIGIALDADNSKWYIRVNGTWQLSGDPIAGTGFVHNNLSGVLAPRFSNATGSGSQTISANFGQRPFAYTPPTGFKALNTQNLPESTVVDGSQYFDVSLWTGDGTSPRSITNTGGIQPDFVWGKIRSQADNHQLFDSVRGVGYGLTSNNTNAEVLNNASGYVSAFSENGFTVTAGSSNNEYWNTTGKTYVAWQWKANGAGVSNTDGSITSTVSANPTAGFSIVTYTGVATDNTNFTVGHGLGVKPAMIIIKNRDWAASSKAWPVFHQAISTGGVFLDSTDISEAQNFDYFWGAQPNSTTFSIRSDSTVSAANRYRTNGQTDGYVAYCFSEVAGYSAFGSYTGNGSADGPFVFCGFRPAFILLKRTDSTGNWSMYDNERSTYNASTRVLYPNLSNAEDASTDHFDWLSNGFKMKSTNQNTNGGTFIYMAFAEHPFKNTLAV
jgi:hypothetical protein